MSSDIRRLARMRKEFPTFLAERFPVLCDFAEAIGIAPPARIVANPIECVPFVDAWMSLQTVDPDDRAWIVARMGYFIGEVFVAMHGGHWSVCEAADGRFFARYVVGQFATFPNRNAMIDPFSVAAEYVDEPVGRSLGLALREVEAALPTL